MGTVALSVPDNLNNRARRGHAVITTTPDSCMGGKGLVTGAARLAAKNADEVAGAALRQTEAGMGVDAADDAYDAIRTSTTDVEAIARNTGIKPENVQNVKDPLFNNEHLIDRYVDLGVPPTVGRFDSDPGIAESWERLTNGTHTPADMDLLRHEAAEAWVEKTRGAGAAELPVTARLKRDFDIPVTQDGLKFLGSRTTGPTSHFLMVKFGEEDTEPNFVSVDPNGVKPEPDKIASLKAALVLLTGELPICDRYYPVEFGLTQRDSANEFHYGALLTDIFSEAEKSLS